jgi:putative ABC transport system ATP-binding protein
MENQSKSANPLLYTEKISRVFKSGHEKIHALDDVSVNVYPGEITLLVGRSGSGKTTLLNILSSMDKPNSGSVFFEGSEISSLSDTNKDLLRRKKMGFVFQSIALISLMSAYENVDFALRISGYDKEGRHERINECLKTVGLINRAKHRPAELSGGEQQRVAIARAIAHRPNVLFADEPTAELDTHLGLQVVKTFRKMIKENDVAIVMSSHDANMMALSDHIYKLEDGRITEEKRNIIQDGEADDTM